MAKQAKNGQFVADRMKSQPQGETTGDQSGRRGHQHHNGQQTDFGDGWHTVGSALYGNGGSRFNPMGFPGYETVYRASYSTYRLILNHPIVRLARAIRYGPVSANTWEYEPVNKVGEPFVEEVRITFNPLRTKLVNDFYKRGGDFGWAGGEPIYEIDGSRYLMTRVKPLLQDHTDCLKDKQGNFTGLRNYGADDEEVNLSAPFKAWKYTYDAECDYPYGRSWLENIRLTAWKEWLDAWQQIQRLGNKISGVVTLIQSPAGTFPGANGSTVSYKDAAMKVIAGLAAGAAGAWYPSMTISPDAKGQIDMAKYISELAGKSLTKFEVLDFGKQGDAIVPLLQRMQHAESLMFAGALRSDRTGLEAAKGSRADAEIHTDTGTVNAEEEDEDFALQCQPLVDAFLVANHGPRAKGSVVIRPPSLVDRKSQILRAILMALLNEPSVRIEMAKSASVKKMMKILDIPIEKDFDGDKVELPKPAAPTKKAGKDPEGGRPPKATEARLKRKVSRAK